MAVAGKSHGSKVAYLIPGIAISYADRLEIFMRSPEFRERCEIAGVDRLVKHYVRAASAPPPEIVLDTLPNQKLSYVVNCCVCDSYRRKGITPDFTLGYSMGIYTALYAAGYYTFETGLRIIEKAYEILGNHCRTQGKEFAMGLILGLTEDEINSLVLNRVDSFVEIVLYNGPRGFVIAGEESGVEDALRIASSEGAFRATRLEASYPYHSSILRPVDPDFRKSLGTPELKEPQALAVSLIDGMVVRKDAVVDVIVRSIYTPLRLDNAICRLVEEYGVRLSYETCPAGSMKKMVRHITKSLKVHSFDGDLSI